MAPPQLVRCPGHRGSRTQAGGRSLPRARPTWCAGHSHWRRTTPTRPSADALNWAFGELLGGYFGKRPAECDAICAAVTERFLDRPEILPMVDRIWTDVGWAPQVRPFLETVLKRSTNRDIQGAACYGLAKAHERLAGVHRILADPLGGETARRNYGPDNVRLVLALDRAQLKREAAAYYTRIIQEYASVQPFKGRPTLGEQARSSLFRIQNLEIGCTIPDIDARDLDGKPIKLSDYRGKVLLVAFWAGWCGPCMGMVPIEKALVDRMAGRPFAMVGVNGDKTAEEGRSVAARNKINWRSVWDGGSQGTTATRWGVQGWPTSYLVDAGGVIRDSNLRGDDLDKAVERRGGNRGRSSQPARNGQDRERALSACHGNRRREYGYRPAPSPGSSAPGTDRGLRRHATTRVRGVGVLEV